jgi:hypothetical protein
LRIGASEIIAACVLRADDQSGMLTGAARRESIALEAATHPALPKQYCYPRDREHAMRQCIGPGLTDRGLMPIGNGETIALRVWGRGAAQQ